MKKLFKFLIATLLTGSIAFAQDDEKPELSVNLHYYNVNGKMQYLKVKTLGKEKGKFQAAKDIAITLYLDEAIEENRITTVKTNDNGEAKAIIPPALKDAWTASHKHKFIAVASATKKFEETTSELEIARAKIILDTLFEEDTRKITAQVLAYDSAGWVPVKEVELKLGVRRLGGDLKIGEEENYTTDSLGQVVGDFKLDSLPTSDASNKIVLVAKTEDNDQFGNLIFEKPVPWGIYMKEQLTAQTEWFNQRTLWGTSNKTPLWLLFMAYSIMAGVWGVIIYLVFQVFKLKKLGETPGKPSTKISTALQPAEV